MAASSSQIPISGCLRKVRNREEVQPLLQRNKRLRSEISEQLADQPVTPHDIFLSHSGAQKGFVKDLYEELSHRGFSTFFDLTHHSLPLAKSFPKRIFSAAKDCKLAVVVLSEDFVSSRWPMMELCAFLQANVRILPLFFKISPEDLKKDSNLERWGKAWEVFSVQDTRIQLTEWRAAIRALCSKNGLTFKGHALEGETTYLRHVISGICEIVPLASKFHGPHMHFPGMNRLCQGVLDRFEKMESPGKVSVLGLYGLPGSGKSTLCQRLRDHFFPIYGGRSLYLEVPTKPSTADLVRTFKQLLSLTDFNDRHNIAQISELGQLYNRLDSYQLPRCRVFLVIDNISDESWEALRMFLLQGVGHGSKVILVARTFHILQPAFRLLELEQSRQHYKWKEMQIPCINETEAIQILLLTLGRPVDQQHISLTPIVRIVRMCNFGSGKYPIYLPLVMKTMGAMLIKYNANLVQWESDLEEFWGRVKTHKVQALNELVQKSFEALGDEELQLLFFDLSLFILPLQKSLKEIYVLLSSIYDGRSVTDIELMIKDLERQCFLTIADRFCSNTLRIHDVYLEFAKSFSEAPSRFNSSILSYYWRNDKYTTGAKDGKVLSLKQVEGKRQRVRAMILEVEGDGYERVELQGFSSLKALVVRNCKSLEVLKLVGLSSLASLDILNCPNLRHLDPTSDVCNVKRLIISSPERGNITFQLRALRGPGEALLARILKWWQTPQISSLDLGFAGKTRGLQDLRLENTGIRRLTDMGSCWPELQNVTIKECYLEAFEVGNLSKLKYFYFDDHGDQTGTLFYDKYRETQVWKSKKSNKKFMLRGKGLLEGCPQLEQVEIQSAFFEKGELGTLPPNLRSIVLRFWYPARMLPDLSPSAHTLETVDLLWCEKLEKVSFLVEFGKLTTLDVRRCPSLVELTGLGFLVSLVELTVAACFKLEAIVGPFDNLKMLKYFTL